MRVSAGKERLRTVDGLKGNSMSSKAGSNDNAAQIQEQVKISEMFWDAEVTRALTPCQGFQGSHSPVSPAQLPAPSPHAAHGVATKLSPSLVTILLCPCRGPVY